MPHRTKMTPENLEECRRVRELILAEKARSKITYKDVGKMIDKSEKTVAAIVTGRLKVSLEVGQSLSKVFGVPLAEILPWTALLGANSEASHLLADLQDLTPENLLVAKRLIRNLADSQE